MKKAADWEAREQLIYRIINKAVNLVNDEEANAGRQIAHQIRVMLDNVEDIT